MRAAKTLHKVTAFVTRGQDDTAELLLLQHPLAGTQLPAGTAELGESPEAAVRREVMEETGLVAIALTTSLGTWEERIPQGHGAVLRPTKIFSEPSFDASSEGYALRRGSPVELLGEAGQFVEVVAEPLDEHAIPPQRVPGVRGYIRHSLLARTQVRHFFHLTLTAPTPDEWHSASDGHLFLLRWAPLRPKPALHEAQAPWLAAFHDDLVRLTSPGARPAAAIP